ncbi:hypothetical protein ACHAPT_010620 [Fusarium lateritium]
MFECGTDFLEYDVPTGHAIPPWCGLCNNDIVDNDDLTIVVTRKGRGSALQVDKMLPGFKYNALDKGLTAVAVSTFISSKNEYFYFELKDTSYTRNITACHSKCLEAITPSRVPEVLQRAAYTFVPSKRERKRREEWLLAKCADTVSTGVRWLPPEVSWDIARRCSSAMALPYAESVPGSVTYRKPMFMAMIKYAIWARFVKFDGVAYVAELSNIRFPDGVVSVLMPRTREIDAIYVAQDNLGIRRIILGNSDKPPQVSPKPSLRWWACPFSPQGQLRGHSDGIKLRKLSSVSSTVDELKCQQMWVIPQPLKKQFRFHNRRYSSRIPRFNFFECNHPDIIGYSACWYRTVSVVHAHVPGEDLRFYANTAADFPSGVWLYLPMDKGELVTELWDCTAYPLGLQSLAMKTSKGRVWSMGPQSEYNSVWTLLDMPPACASRIYIEETPNEAPQLAFESPSPNEGYGANRALEEPRIPHRSTSSSEVEAVDFIEAFSFWGEEELDDMYMHSSAPLSDVTKMALCLEEAKQGAGSPCILGILLHYGDGRERAVGSVRPDLLGPFIDVGESTGLSLRKSGTRHLLAEVTLSTADEPDGCIRISWCGSLVWWFKGDGCEITHEKDGMVYKVVNFR